MEIISKKNKPIISLRQKTYDLFTLVLFVVNTFLFFLMLTSVGKIEFNEQILYTGIMLLFFIILYICCIFRFEMYDKYFVASFSLIFLPFKIIIVKILFDNINWIDCEEINSRGPWGVRNTSFQINFHLKNHKKTLYSFDGKKAELENIVYNWKSIAKYERNTENEI